MRHRRDPEGTPPAPLLLWGLALLLVVGLAGCDVLIAPTPTTIARAPTLAPPTPSPIRPTPTAIPVTPTPAPRGPRAQVSTLAGPNYGTDGVGAAATFRNPTGFAISADGSFALIADEGNHIIRRLRLANNEVTTVAGKSGSAGNADGVGGAARFFKPASVALAADGNTAVIADSGNHTIRRLNLANGEVSTVAGTAGQAGASDGAGTVARFNGPQGIAVSSNGSFALVADTANNLIRRVEIATGNVTTLAGASGKPDSTDGVGSQARFNAPEGIALSGDGALALIADTSNSTIRQLVVASGTVTTLAGKAGNEESTDGVGAAALFSKPAGVTLSRDGSLALVADTANSTIRSVVVASATVTTLAGGIAGNKDNIGTDAELNSPQGVVVNADKTTAYVTDTANQTIRQIAIATQQVTTIAGQANSGEGSTDGAGAAVRFRGPQAVAISANGQLGLIADTANHTIRRVDVASGQVTTLAGAAGQAGNADGAGAAARFNNPTGVALSADGALALVVDSGNQTIRRIEVASGQVTTLAGAVGQVGPTDGAGAAARFNNPTGVALSADGKFALIADTANHTIRRIDLSTGNVTTVAGIAGSDGRTDGPGNVAKFAGPRTVSLTADGKLALVADTNNSLIRQLDLSTGNVTTLAGGPLVEGAPTSVDAEGIAARFVGPSSVAVSGDGSSALVADSGNATIRHIALKNALVTTIAGTVSARGLADGVGGEARFDVPAAVALTSDGRVALVVDSANNTLRRITIGG